MQRVFEQEIVGVTKNSGEGLSTLDVHKVFLSAETIEDIKAAVAMAKDRLYVSWSTVDGVDSAGERIPIEDAIAQARVHIDRGGSISNEHSNDIVGKTLAYRCLMHPETKTVGIFVLNKIHADHEMDEKVWKDIQSRKMKGSSVGGFRAMPPEFEIGPDGKAVKVIQGFRQNELAVTENPANPFATIEGFSVVAKSDNQLIDGKYFVKENTVYQITKSGNLLDSFAPFSGTNTPSPVNKSAEDDGVSVKNTPEQIQGVDITMTENKVEKNDSAGLLEVAMSKLTKGELLNADEAAVIKSAVEDKEVDADEEEDVEKTAGEEVSQEGGDIPEEEKPSEVNQVDVAKTVEAAVKKALAEQNKAFTKELSAIKKSFTTVSTPRPTNEPNPLEKVVKNSDFLGTNPVDIALGTVKKSWTELQAADKKTSVSMEAYL